VVAVVVGVVVGVGVAVAVGVGVGVVVAVAVVVAVVVGPVPRPTSIVLTRISAGRLDDDGLVSSLKQVADGLAHAIGVNDRDFVWLGDRPGVRILPSQRSEGRGRFGVEIILRWG
jgi:hypothetical protein